jgi:outer membrane lipoprotein SlyB
LVTLKRFPLILSFSLLVGCSGSQFTDPVQSVIVDTANVDLNEYQVDLTECKVYANKVDVADQTTKGAVGGAIVGSVIGAIIGNSDSSKKIGGTAGVLGGLEANADARKEKNQVMRNCLRGRGYKVLN